MTDDAAEVDSPLAPTDGVAASLWKRCLVATGLTALALALGTAMAALGVRSGGHYRLVGSVVLTELGFVLVTALFLADAAGSVFGRLDGFGAPAARRAELSRHVGTALPAGRLRVLWSVVGWSAGLAALAIVVWALAGAIGVPIQPAYGQDPGTDGTADTVLLLVLSVFVVAPAEEGFFRGVLQTYLGEATSERGAILTAALLFAIAHVPTSLTAGTAGGAAAATLLAFVVGAAIGVAYEQSGSLPVAIGVHACYNCLLLLSTLLLG